MPDARTSPRAQFCRMEESTSSDWQIISVQHRAYAERLPDRLLADLKALDEDPSGFPLNRFEHSLQAATRALRDGRDEEYVVCALLHDIGDASAPYNHPEVAAAILRPFVSERNHWMVAQHGLFQGYHYFDKIGLDRHARDVWRGHDHFAHTAEFCALYDQTSFDRNYDNLPIDTFVPMVHRVLARPSARL